jgi:uncharacterized protein (TIGR00730 family)
MNKICVFCGSSPGAKLEYSQAAEELGRTIATRGMELVYGGSDLGLMGIVALAAIEGGAHVTGIMPRVFEGKVNHPDSVDIHIVDTMHERKARMFELADAFIALPGGFGTIEEIMEIITWAQIGLHKKPCGLLNVCGFYDNLLKFRDHAVQERYIWEAHKAMLLSDPSPEGLLEKFIIYQAPNIEKWRDRI